jgi:hypothetical protein
MNHSYSVIETEFPSLRAHVVSDHFSLNEAIDSIVRWSVSGPANRVYTVIECDTFNVEATIMFGVYGWVVTYLDGSTQSV